MPTLSNATSRSSPSPRTRGYRFTPRNIDPARKRVFDGIFDTLQTGLSKLGTDENKDKTYEPLFVDASKHFVKDGKNNKLRACGIRRIVDAVTGSRTIDKFSRLVSIDEIRSTLSSCR